MDCLSLLSLPTVWSLVTLFVPNCLCLIVYLDNVFQAYLNMYLYLMNILVLKVILIVKDSWSVWSLWKLLKKKKEEKNSKRRKRAVYSNCYVFAVCCEKLIVSSYMFIWISISDFQFEWAFWILNRLELHYRRDLGETLPQNVEREEGKKRDRIGKEKLVIMCWNMKISVGWIWNLCYS